jgi:hypothetical protein
MAKNGPKWPKMGQNGSKWAKMAQKWAKMAQNALLERKGSFFGFLGDPLFPPIFPVLLKIPSSES